MNNILSLPIIAIFLSGCIDNPESIVRYTSPDKEHYILTNNFRYGTNKWKSERTIFSKYNNKGESFLIQRGARFFNIEWISRRELVVYACSADIDKFNTFNIVGDRNIIIDMENTSKGEKNHPCAEFD